MSRPPTYEKATRVTIVIGGRTAAQLRRIAKEKNLSFSRLCALLLTRYAEKQTT